MLVPTRTDIHFSGTTWPLEEVRDPPALVIPHLSSELKDPRCWHHHTTYTHWLLCHCHYTGVLVGGYSMFKCRSYQSEQRFPFWIKGHTSYQKSSPQLWRRLLTGDQRWCRLPEIQTTRPETKEETETKGKTNRNKKPIKKQLLSNKNKNWLLDRYSFLTQILRC